MKVARNNYSVSVVYRLLCKLLALDLLCGFKIVAQWDQLLNKTLDIDYFSGRGSCVGMVCLSELLCEARDI